MEQLDSSRGFSAGEIQIIENSILDVEKSNQRRGCGSGSGTIASSGGSKSQVPDVDCCIFI